MLTTIRVANIPTGATTTIVARIYRLTKGTMCLRQSDTVSGERCACGCDIVAAFATLAHALFFAGDLAQARSVALQAVERPEAPERPTGYIGALGLLAAIDA